MSSLRTAWTAAITAVREESAWSPSMGVTITWSASSAKSEERGAQVREDADGGAALTSEPGQATQGPGRPPDVEGDRTVALFQPGDVYGLTGGRAEGELDVVTGDGTEVAQMRAGPDPERRDASLSLLCQTVRELQTLLARRTGACSTCHRDIATPMST
jgi:hypothetical protein